MENIIELSSEELEKVSGGFIVKNSDGTQCMFCDRCCKCAPMYIDKRGMTVLPERGPGGFFPINGGHLCDDCLKRYKAIMK